MTAAFVQVSEVSPAVPRQRSAGIADAAIDPALTIEIIDSIEGLATLEADWNALFARAGRSIQVFQTFGWIWRWASIFAVGEGADRLAIVTVRRKEALVLVWPLVVERRSGLKVLSWAGDPVSQYGDVLLDDCEDAAALLSQSWRFISMRLAPDLVHLRKVRRDASVTPLLDEIGASSSGITQAPALEVGSSKTFAAYEQRYSAKARKNRRRLLRRLEERGPVGFETTTRGATAADRARLAIILKRAWLKDRGLVSPALMDERVVRFFAEAATGGDRTPETEVSALVSNGETAAVEIAFPCKGRLAVHVIVYSLKFEKAGAGVLLIERMIARAIERGMHTVDLLAPGDAYKLDWADGSVEVADRTLSLTRRGNLYARFYLGFLREQAKAALGAMPLKLRRLVANGYAFSL